VSVREAIAIVGLGCRFAGEAADGAGFWRLLAQARDAVAPIPPGRWNHAAWVGTEPGRTMQTAGGFLPGIDMFDGPFFGIAPREAVQMDPQQRLVLEVAWEALENAGMAPDRLRGVQGGIYLGLYNDNYGLIGRGSPDATVIDGWSASGTHTSVAPGRIAFQLGLTGPAIAIDTACSSSLTAVHLAVQALRSGDCAMALAGGVHLILSPLGLVTSTKLGAASTSSKCKAFDADADGFVHGEGCGVLVLKRLSDAEAAGDRVLAVIRGTAVNQDGRSAGLTAPNGPAQEAVIRAALSNAGLTPDGIDAIEAHGTGTSLGDPIEMHALASVFAGRTRPLSVGSVKTNIGHTEAAAGVAGLIKAVLMLRHQAVPATLHFKRLNPHIDLGGVPIEVPTVTRPAALSRIGVSSFGFSGTNAHVIVERAPATTATADPRPAQVLAISARDATALDALRSRWLDALAAPGADLAGLARATAGRARFPHRLAVVASDVATAKTALAAATPSTAARPRVAFLCTGQGSTYAGMACGLMEISPVFRSVIERCDAVMALGTSLARVFGDAALLARTDYAQPALYALSAGLGALWRSWGIEPVALLGHSVGEYAAAHLAGVLTLEDGARLIARRGKLMQALPAGGAMAALLGDEAKARAVLARHPEIEVAGLNSATAMTVAGPEAAIDRLVADPALAGLALKLPLAHAFHSRLLEPMLDGLQAAADATPHAEALIPVVGNLAGEVVARHDGAYWRAHARQPVRFAAGLETLKAMGVTHLVELGAQPVLSGFARTAAAGLAALPSLTRARPNVPADRHGWTTLLDGLARLWRDGSPVDWTGHHAPYPTPAADAPSYPFQRQRYWFRTEPAAVPASTGGTIAGERIDMANGDVLFRNRFDTGRLPFLADHVVMGETIVPGASHIVAMLAASGEALRDIVFAAPMSLPPGGCRIQLLQHAGQIALHADAKGGWTTHATATVIPLPRPDRIDRATIAQRCTEDLDGPAALHAMLGERGITLGPSFRGINRLFRGDNEALVQVTLPSGVAPVAPLHPAQLDACFQALGATFKGDGQGGAFLPLAVDQAVLHRPFSGPLWAHARIRSDAGGSGDVATGDIVLFDEAGETIASITGLTIKRVGAAILAPDPSERWTYAVEWTAQPDMAVALPPPAAIGALALSAGNAAAPAEEPGLADGLERLAGAYAAQALSDVDARTVVPGQARLHAHLPTMAASTSAAPQMLAEQLVTRFGRRLEIDLACRSGLALPGVLRGQTDPLSVLFGGEGTTVYADPPFARMLNAMVVAALKGMADALPAGRALRVLEIGAGTGAVFDALRLLVPAERLAYSFTDISPAFIDAARERFGAALTRCEPFDIERAPDLQGFVPGSYDVVLAANVLHATRDLRASLRHAARLLAPAGVLLLLEASRRSNWSDLVFGLTPGWWRFADTDLRATHPLLSAGAWRDLLLERFGDAETVDSPGGGAQVLAIAQAPRAERDTLVWEAPAGLAPLDLADTALQAVQRVLAQPQPPALRLVTRGAQPVGTVPISADQAVLLGLGRVVALEHPELDCRLLDLPPGVPLETAASAPPEALEAAWRDGTWHLPRLVRASLPRDSGFATSGTHLVSGGLGGLGPPLAAWLRAHGAERVVLMARRTQPGVALPDGTDVMVGDVAVRADVDRVVAACGPALRGVFHLAGTLSDAAILTLKRADLAQVFAAKVDGARNLEAATAGLKLDAFVLFGSSAGLIGNPGQAPHAAANAYLGVLADARRQRGLPGLCLDWGAWGEAGTMTRSTIGERLVAAGAALMAPDRAFAALGRALVSGHRRLMVAAIDWPRFLSGYGDNAPGFFAAVAPPRRAAVQPRAAGEDPRASHAALKAFVAEAAAIVLGAAPGEALDPDVPLNEAGLDSLMALELRKSLGTGLGLTLPATLLFNFPTITALADHLAGEVGLAGAEEPPAAAAVRSAPVPIAQDRIVESVMGMSEDEMAAAIAEEFALTVNAND